MRQLLFNRGIHTARSAQEYFDDSGLYNRPEYDPFRLPGMEAAVERLLAAIRAGERVAVYGDYDVDGLTAVVLITQVLEELGASVRPYIPNRFEEGYGLNSDAVDTLANEGIRLILTVDCGIRSVNEALYARERGVDLIISDHHEPKEVIPDALAVICQKLPESAYPNRNLAGVGLAFKLAQALLKRTGVFIPQAEEWLDLVALGTVADIVPLTGENRSLVRSGLRLLRQGTRPGVISLAGVAGVKLNRLTAADIGFLLAPRLNANGRLDTGLKALSLLMSRDLYETGYLAQELDVQNRERQELTRSIQAAAELLADPSSGLIFAVHPEFNQGVVGLVASRLSETYYRPAVIGQQMEAFTRASCRSIPEFHITRALDECADLMERHGGHAAAAGFTIRNERVPELRQRLEAIVRRELDGADLRPLLRADMVLEFNQLNIALYEDIGQLQPTGEGNRDAVFVSRNVTVRQKRLVGKDNAHLKLVLKQGQISIDAIAFNQGKLAPELPDVVDVMYHFEINEYNQIENFQLRIKDIRAAGSVDGIQA